MNSRIVHETSRFERKAEAADFGHALIEQQDTLRSGNAPAARATGSLIFVPIDFSEQSIRAARMGIKIARKTGGRVMFFHSVHLNLGPYGPANLGRLKSALCREAMTKAEPLLRMAQMAGVSALCAIEEGAHGAAILRAAKQWDADVIIMASQPRGWWQRLFRPRILEKVLSEANCPVVVL